MKKILFITIFVSCILNIGCTKITSDPGLCNGCPSGEPCEEYAPKGVTVSWTDFNSVANLQNYFVCHRATLKEHLGDTVRLVGWVYFKDPSSDEPDFGEWSLERGEIFLVDDENHRGHNKIAYLEWDVEDSIWMESLSSLREHFDDFLMKKWYVVAKVGVAMLPGTGCCDHDPRYWIIDIDTIPNRL